ncbi:ATP-binding cassette domain-containing protein [Bacillus inaquosorum]|nr:ATP-binding cassette domain-containing protein [Bacillus inaquosorum]
MTIIRKGKGIKTLDVRDTNQDELASLMVGREVSFKTEKKVAQPGAEVLAIDGMTVKDTRGIEAVRNLSLSVKAGEIVGIAGVDGNGQSELIEAITGLRKTDSGTITLNGKQIQNLPPRKVTESGIGHIPKTAINTVSSSIFRSEIIWCRKAITKSRIQHLACYIKATCIKSTRLISEYDVRTPDEYTHVRALSGGNQQKRLSGGK